MRDNGRMVRVLFSVDVRVPAKSPNTMQEGPGPVLLGFLQEAVDNQLSDAPGCLVVPWRNDVGSFALHAVQELAPCEAEQPAARGPMTKKQAEALVREAYDNFPEASMCLSCVGWKYKEFRFTFVDQETGKTHVVRLPDAMRGLKRFCAAVDAGKLPGLGLPAEYRTDTGLWDASAFDALNQMVIFGEVLYG